MNYGQCLIALETGETVLASIAGEEIETIISAISTRRTVYHDKTVNNLIGAKYISIECRGKHDNSVYHFRPEQLKRTITKEEENMDAIIATAIREYKEVLSNG